MSLCTKTIKTLKSINMDYLITLSHLGLFMVLASWFLCLTEFAQACSQPMHLAIKMTILGTLLNLSVLFLVRSGLKMKTLAGVILLVFEFSLALLYVTATFFVYQGIVN